MCSGAMHVPRHAPETAAVGCDRRGRHVPGDDGRSRIDSGINHRAAAAALAGQRRVVVAGWAAGRPVPVAGGWLAAGGWWRWWLVVAGGQLLAGGQYVVPVSAIGSQMRLRLPACRLHTLVPRSPQTTATAQYSTAHTRSGSSGEMTMTRPQQRGFGSCEGRRCMAEGKSVPYALLLRGAHGWCISYEYAISTVRPGSPLQVGLARDP
eukprot:COSAG01_NODE_839_length_13190_cov_138.958368_5_plen_208_part_00